MTKIGKASRQQALGKMTIDGKKTIFTTAGQSVKMKKGDTFRTNKRNEQVIVRKNGNRVILNEYGRTTRVKGDGTRVVTLSPEEIRRGEIPAGPLKPIKGSLVNPKNSKNNKGGR